MEVEKENLLFANKMFLDNLTLPSQIIEREKKAKELIRYLLGYKHGLVVPFVSVYGRSGSGKSTIVKFVCENLDEDIPYAFVNLRKARTVFGCANLILTELGQPSLKSAQGINTAIEHISNAIEQRLTNDKKNNNSNNNGDSNDVKLFILVLDEFDVLYTINVASPLILFTNIYGRRHNILSSMAILDLFATPCGAMRNSFVLN
jgi:archaeal cell division control protein 6